MDNYMKSNVSAVKYFLGAVMFITALSFMSNQTAGTITAAVVEGQEDAADTISHWDMPQAEEMPVATTGETYTAEYDRDGWPTRGYLSSDEVRGNHLGSKSLKVRFRKRLTRTYKDFIDTMGKKAVEISVHFSKNKGIDIPPSVILAQAISESRYGTSRLAVEGKNYFGVQYRGNRRGVKGPIPAKDADHNKDIKTYKFANYESTWWSLYHHADLLKRVYAKRLVKVDIPLREQWMAALCGCDDSRMLAADAKAERIGKGYYYAAACEYIASDGKTSKYVATLKYLIRLYKLDKLDDEWLRRKR
jgi:flagellum-specific peptidoglycan hydrolase FlgJ